MPHTALLLVLQLVSAGSANAAPVAEPPRQVAEVSGWPIYDNKGDCSTIQNYRSETRLWVKYDYPRNLVTVFLGNSAWKSIREAGEYRVTALFENGSSYGPYTAHGAKFEDHAGIYVDYRAEDFLQDFAESRAVRFSLGETLLAQLDLTGTRALVRRLAQCSIESYERHPPDPFATVPAASASGVAGDQPARQTGGSISDADYPASAIRAGAQGTTRVSISVGTTGVVTGCSVTGLSGSSALDSTTCTLIQRRFRFQPATRDGEPTPTTISRSITWRLPEDEPPLPALEATTSGLDAASSDVVPSAHAAPHPGQPLPSNLAPRAVAAAAQIMSAIWVQVAVAPSLVSVASELTKVRSAAPAAFANHQAHTAPIGSSVRLLLGPFATQAEARATVEQLRKRNVPALSWTSPAGVLVTPLRLD
jgi:protein TonB